MRRTTLRIQSTAETSSIRQGGSRPIYIIIYIIIIYIYYIYRRGEIEKRRRCRGDQGRITLDQDVMVEEATDILPPLDRSWRIMRFPPVLDCRYIHTYEHAPIYAYKHTYMYTDVHTCMHSTYMYTCIHKYIFACVHTYMHM